MPDRVNDLQHKIKTISEGEYAVAKQDVDRLRQELGQPPLPSLQTTLEEKSAECVHMSPRFTTRDVSSHTRRRLLSFTALRALAHLT